MKFLKVKSTGDFEGAETYYDTALIKTIYFDKEVEVATISFGWGEGEYITVTNETVDMGALRKYVRANVLI